MFKIVRVSLALTIDFYIFWNSMALIKFVRHIKEL